MRAFSFLAFFLIVVFQSTSTFAGTINGAAIEDYPWRTSCEQPQVPKIFITKKGSVNEAKEAYQKFESEVVAFIKCAGEDYKKDLASIQSGGVARLTKYNDKAKELIETIQNEVLDGTFPNR